jgi:hypothetical protein
MRTKISRIIGTIAVLGALGTAPLVIAGSTAGASAALPSSKTYVPGPAMAGGVESLGVTSGGVESLTRPGAISYGGFEGL